MGRACSRTNIQRAVNAHMRHPHDLGPQLGVLVYRSAIPAHAIALLLRASLPTLYRWFFGVNDVAAPFRGRVARLIPVLEAALESGILPAHGSAEERTQVLVEIVKLHIARKTQL